VCAGLFERLGFVTKSATCGADAGIDIHLYRPPSDQPVNIVQCKAWTKKVGVKVIRELRGVMTSERVAKGIFVTTSTYSDDAIAFAKANQIYLMNGDAVLKAILKLTEEQQASLLQRATAGDYTTPTCASCGVKMVAKKGRVSGKPFWGCVNYPKCKMKLYVAGA
jgi:restriction system protein